MMMGIRARREVTGLSANTSLRPDLLLSLPSRTVLSDVAVCHPLAPGVRNQAGSRALGLARNKEAVKRNKYLAMSSTHCFEQLPVALETTGGMGPAAVMLVKAMADATEEQLRMWTREHIVREVAGSLAMAVQRGNAMTMLEGYEFVRHIAEAHRTATTEVVEQNGAVAKKKVSSTQTTDEDDDSEEEEQEDEE